MKDGGKEVEDEVKGDGVAEDRWQGGFLEVLRSL